MPLPFSRTADPAKVSLFVVLCAFRGLLIAVASERASPLSFRVLAYNTHLLPRVGEAFASRRGRGDYRAEAIGRAVVKYDIVGLCEVFDPRYRAALIDAALQESGGGFQLLWTKKPRGVGFVNSGLLLLSRFPVEEQHTITYQAASGFRTHGFRADSFAAKGAMHARLRLRDDPPLLLDCFITHLESRSPAARAAQLEQLADFLRKHSDVHHPALLMGDLNVPADTSLSRVAGSPYTELVAALARSGRKLEDIWLNEGRGPSGTSDPISIVGGNRIDYIWLSRGDTGRALARAVEVLRFLDSDVPEGSLSDHSGVAASLEFP